MVRKTTSLLLAGALTLGSVALIGCQQKSEGQQTREQALAMDKAADMIQEGENNIREGDAMIARGEAAKKQNNDAQGDSLIAAGKAKKAEGEAKVKEGKRLREKSE